MKLPIRKQIRLPSYDYSSNNCYFVTICTHQKMHLFGIQHNLTKIGMVVQNHICELPNHYKYVRVPKYVIMPNHIHMIIQIDAPESNIQSCKLSTIVGAFKAGVSRAVRNEKMIQPLWQSRFYEHIIRDDIDFETIWNYIDENPIKWELDEYY